VSKRILILGGHGNGAVIASAIADANDRGDDEWIVAGYLNDRMEPGEDIHGHPVLGKTGEIGEYVRKGYYAINTILRIDGQQERIDMFESFALPDKSLATVVHPTAYVAPTVELGPGVVIMPKVTVSPGVVFGKGCLIMVAATIGHDSRLGKYCHVAAQACVGARVKLGDGVHIGMNATVGENITIGTNAALGMGAVLTKDVGHGEVWVGNPAKFLRKAE
jgi:sugar O-acyltransferase (sialic acid O-acetyltransferase NeuD family)